jgi:hypothetical protein
VESDVCPQVVEVWKTHREDERATPHGEILERRSREMNHNQLLETPCHRFSCGGCCW